MIDKKYSEYRPVFAVINADNDQNINHTISTLKSIGQVDVFSTSKYEVREINGDNEYEISEDVSKHSVLVYNDILKYYISAHQSNPSDKFILHIVSNGVHINSSTIDGVSDCDMMTGFVSDLHGMMTTMRYDVWFSTVTDQMNYVYSKYNSRVNISLDSTDVDCSKFGMGNVLVFTSHSNTGWMSFNSDYLDSNKLFNDNFKVPMFYIIEYLARRKATALPENKFYLMNMYMTVDSENGKFNMIPSNLKEDFSQEAVQKEDQLFRSMNINYAPDNNIDTLLESIGDWIHSLKKES